jgi:hypothetical protein
LTIICGEDFVNFVGNSYQAHSLDFFSGFLSRTDLNNFLRSETEKNWKILYQKKRQIEENWMKGKYTIVTLEGHRAHVWNISIFDNNTKLISTSWDKTVYCFSIITIFFSFHYRCKVHRNRFLSECNTDKGVGSVNCSMYQDNPN